MATKTEKQEESAKPAQSGLERMTSHDVAQQVAEGEYGEDAPRRGVVLSQHVEPNFAKRLPPFLAIAQSQSEAVHQRQAQAGDLMLRNFPPIQEAMLIPISTGDFREYRPDKTKGARPKCRSNDGILGEGDPGGICAQCPLSKWGPRNPQTGAATAPPCKEGVMVCFYSVDYRTPVLFPFRGREIAIAEDIRMRAAFSGMGSFAIKMTTQLTSNQLGSWYVPRIEFLLDVPEEQKEIVARVLGSMQEPAAASQSAPEGVVIEGEVVNDGSREASSNEVGAA